MYKQIGTLVPLSAISSTEIQKNDAGTFAAGLVFLDWLKNAKLNAWQLLPLYQTQLEQNSATKHVPSPYKGYGVGIDPKYLPQEFSKMRPTEAEKEEFLFLHKDWLQTYALFCALADFFKTDDWRLWDIDIRNRTTEAISFWTKKLAKEVDSHILMQWQLHIAYAELRKKAKQLDIALIGDLPFYPSVQSPLVWANREVFQIESNGSLKFVSGIPNTAQSHFGRQIWGHPLYNWSNRENVLNFWKMRLSYHASLFDHIRFDHAKAFFAYGAMDIQNPKNDAYKKGPGETALKELITYSQKIGLSIFAEDSGENIKELQLALAELQIPGIKIFRFAIKESENRIIPKYADIPSYPENCIAYTTTHDTETLVGYLEKLSTDQKQELAKASSTIFNPDAKIFAKNIRNCIIESNAKLVIIPIQDFLLTTDRINIPGTELSVNDPNWNFHLNSPIENLPITF